MISRLVVTVVVVTDLIGQKKDVANEPGPKSGLRSATMSNCRVNLDDDNDGEWISQSS